MVKEKKQEELENKAKESKTEDHKTEEKKENKKSKKEISKKSNILSCAVKLNGIIIPKGTIIEEVDGRYKILKPYLK